MDNRGLPTLVGVGLPVARARDLYHRVLTARWSTFFAVATLGYFTAHALFASLYLAQPGSITNTDGTFFDAYFFSVQTMMTIGYGVMAPATRYAHVLVAIEAYVGLLSTAILTGLVFAKFSRPTAHVLFSNVCCVSRHDGQPTLLFRMANARGNRIMEATCTLAFAQTVQTKEGEMFRRVVELPLVRAKNSMFFIGWTAMHRIDEASPLYGQDRASLEARNVELLAVVTGLDEDMGVTVSARRSYVPAEIRWGERFVDIIEPDPGPDGLRRVDYGRFHETQPSPE